MDESDKYLRCYLWNHFIQILELLKRCVTDVVFLVSTYAFVERFLIIW